MPELPEIEVLARHLRPLLRGKTIRGVDVRRAKVLSPTALKTFQRALLGAKFTGLSRRGKYLLFQLHSPSAAQPVHFARPSGHDGPDVSGGEKRAPAKTRRRGS